MKNTLHNIEEILLLVGSSLWIAGFGVFFVGPHSSYQTAPILGIPQYAQRILAQCARTEYRPACYDEEIPRLANVLSMEEMFGVTKIIQQNDDSYWYCHVLAHRLSEQETRKDSEKWKEVFTRCPLNMCSYGCMHGAFLERFRNEHIQESQIPEVAKELGAICERRDSWDPTDLERFTCYHAVGHLLMYITNADTNRALAMCNTVAVHESSDFSSACFDGVFMQIFQPLEPEDFALIEGKAPTEDTVYAFCSAYNGIQRASCWGESWPLFAEEIKRPEGAISFCSRFPEAEVKERCFNGVFFITAAHLGMQNEPVRKFCDGFPGELRKTCYHMAVNRYMETDKRLIDRASRLCQDVADADVRNACFEGLYASGFSIFHKESPEFALLCSVLPGTVQEKCLKKTSPY